jgi:hypothetical protein
MAASGVGVAVAIATYGDGAGEGGDHRGGQHLGRGRGVVADAQEAMGNVVAHERH